MAKDKAEKKDEALAMAKEACAEIRKLKQQLKNGGKGSEMRTGWAALKEQRKSRDGSVRLTALLGVLVFTLLFLVTPFAADVLRSGWGPNEDFGEFSVYGDEDTDSARLEVDDLTINDDLIVTDDASVGGDLTVVGTLTATVSATTTNFSADIGLQQGEIIRNDIAGVVENITTNTSRDITFEIHTPKQNGVALFKSTGDNGDDAGDIFGIENDGAGNLTIQSDASAKGTLADKVIITSAGKITLADDLVVSGNDIDSGASTMTIGAAAATRVEIADAGIVTDVEGSLSVAQTAAFIGVATFTGQPVLNAGLQVVGDVNIDLGATSDEIDIDMTNTAGTASTPLIGVNDDRTGATANESSEATLWIDAEGAYAIGVLDGIVAIESALDVYAAGALTVGGTTASSLALGASGIDTTVLGPLNVLEATTKGIDTTGAGALHIGEDVATSVQLGQTDADTIILGDLTVRAGTGNGIDTTAAGELFIG